MNFRRVSDWAQVSECGRYSVAAGRVCGVYRFTAHRLSLKGGPGTLLDATDTAQAARDLCEADAAKRAKEAA